MDFELSEDERSLADGMRRLCAGRFPLERVRQGEGRRVLDLDDWAQLAGAGVFSLCLPEADGGAGLGVSAAAVVFEELGRALVPGPLSATHVAAGLVKGAASGEVPVGLVRASSSSTGHGVLPVLVADLGSLGALLVVSDEAVHLVAPEDLEAEPLARGLDPLTPMWRLPAVPEGAVLGDGTLAASLWRRYLVVTGALLVGTAAATCDMAVEYAKHRRQFDRPIGSFQAVKHLCADMLVRTETSRAAVHAAAVTLDEPDVGDADRACAGAALLAAQAADSNARTCIQVHGGMGFTWEVPAHLYLMRSQVLSRSVGSLSSLTDTVAERF